MKLDFLTALASQVSGLQQRQVISQWLALHRAEIA